MYISEGPKSRCFRVRATLLYSPRGTAPHRHPTRDSSRTSSYASLQSVQQSTVEITFASQSCRRRHTIFSKCVPRATRHQSPQLNSAPFALWIPQCHRPHRSGPLLRRQFRHLPPQCRPVPVAIRGARILIISAPPPSFVRGNVCPPASKASGPLATKCLTSVATSRQLAREGTDVVLFTRDHVVPACRPFCRHFCVLHGGNA